MRIDWNDRPSNRPPAATKHRPPAVFVSRLVVAIVVVFVVDGISTTMTTTIVRDPPYLDPNRRREPTERPNHN
ncbi:MAG: hypothetical protein MK080_03195, partial [Opitutales bacterium]|nr:hypothetical protein [Opitutales bacterium]